MENKSTIYTKILNVQSSVWKMTKDQAGYNYKYFDINQILEKVTPLLQEQWLILLQPLTNIDWAPAIKTMIIEAETGEMIEYVTPLKSSNELDPQKVWSAVTYYRRYALQSMLSLQADDDDGAISKPKTTQDKPRFNDKQLQDFTAYLPSAWDKTSAKLLEDINSKYKVNQDMKAKIDVLLSNR